MNNLFRNFRIKRNFLEVYPDIFLKRRFTCRNFIPSASPGPFLTAQNIFVFLFSIVMGFHYYLDSVAMVFASASFLALIVSFWFKNIIIEAPYMTVYAPQNSKNPRTGFAMFLLSEVVFFFILFGLYFYLSLVPSIGIGLVRPSCGIEITPVFSLPFLNSFILITSGFILIYVQKIIIESKPGSRDSAIKGFIVTLGLAVYFLAIQYYEFTRALLPINGFVYIPITSSIAGAELTTNIISAPQDFEVYINTFFAGFFTKLPSRAKAAGKGLISNRKTPPFTSPWHGFILPHAAIGSLILYYWLDGEGAFYAILFVFLVLLPAYFIMWLLLTIRDHFNLKVILRAVRALFARLDYWAVLLILFIIAAGEKLELAALHLIKSIKLYLTSVTGHRKARTRAINNFYLFILYIKKGRLYRCRRNAAIFFFIATAISYKIYTILDGVQILLLILFLLFVILPAAYLIGFGFQVIRFSGAYSANLRKKLRRIVTYIRRILSFIFKKK